MNCQINPERFRRVLERAVSQETVKVFIFPYKSQDYTDFINWMQMPLKSGLELSPMERELIGDAKQGVLKPVLDYLSRLGVPNQTLRDYSAIIARMLPKQILELSRQSYVSMICPA